MAVGGLTERELEVLRLVAAGKSEPELAAILGVSPYTARFHFDNARRKLDAVNRPHAVARLIALGGLTEQGPPKDAAADE